MSEASFSEEQAEQVFGDKKETKCSECGEDMDSMEISAGYGICFSCKKEMTK